MFFSGVFWSKTDETVGHLERRKEGVTGAGCRRGRGSLKKARADLSAVNIASARQRCPSGNLRLAFCLRAVD